MTSLNRAVQGKAAATPDSATPPAVMCACPRPHVALVTINRPERHNAVNQEVAESLDHYVAALDANPDVRVVVLTGAGGKAFSTGADLAVVANGGITKLFTVRGGFAGFVFAPHRKVWIAAVEGYAVAGGFELALACDMIVAAAGASFGLPEVKRGLIAAAGGVYRAVRALPRSLAIEMMTTGDSISADQALSFGLLNRVVPVGHSVDIALDLAEKIAANAPLAVQESAVIARQAIDLTDTELQEISKDALARMMATDDFIEGPRAFVERRLPRWTAK